MRQYDFMMEINNEGSPAYSQSFGGPVGDAAISPAFQGRGEAAEVFRRPFGAF